MSEQMSTVGSMSVDRLMARYPATMAVFNAFGVDTCCGAHRSVREAAAQDGIDGAALLAALHHVIGEDR